MRNNAPALLDKVFCRMVSPLQNRVKFFVSNYFGILPDGLRESYRVMGRLPDPDDIRIRADREVALSRNVVPGNRREITSLSGALFHFVPPGLIDGRRAKRDGTGRQGVRRRRAPCRGEYQSRRECDRVDFTSHASISSDRALTVM